ncbi:hypothetical protein G6F57_000640 [Rhizopus arrhizus]|uniref:Myb-like, SWIRM and MPN domain-containing protein 1 n=1 Tax=Rhizopus oryzae TaxID=64495 RepID=A0A9P7BUH1_RHIOR|nr:hypothetical protein G6F23_001554 [Rhizopus arrhizus]KAG1428692.1 hypothetical protein G6F58_000449 [Rhizopus delemar]KAG0768083.1 hypothetical protein G6F24_002248 [Rhizopus arrhizus]KAG0795435.1 hypothetical protein G6F21_002104 [Rhizopus arrhizus]KAG0800526.1 hypothetical protein G6F22_002145 [Rhizopus arrhizus]
MHEEEEEIIDIGQDEEQDSNGQINTQNISDTFVDESLLMIDQEMDSESRQLIEQMLAEEEFYYGKNHSSIPKKKQSDFEPPKKKKGLSSASLPSHKTRWNKEEDDKLLEALDKFGYGHWKLIAEYVGTRNRLQCKNHARHLALAEKIKIPVKQVEIKETEVKKTNENEQETHEVSNETRKETETLKEDKQEANINDEKIKDEREVKDKNQTEDYRQKADENEHKLKDDQQEADVEPKEENDEDEDEEDDLLDIGDTTIEENMIESSISQEIKTEKDEEMTDVSQEEESTMHITQEQKDTSVSQKENMSHISQEEDVANINYDALETKEVIPETNTPFDRFYVSEEEKRQNPEWFKQKYSKTPDRYLKIRNHIIDCWYQCKPRYLTKTQARKGLKDCGDVNAIGRVHSWLESVGAINVDCVTNAPRPPKRVPREMSFEEEDMFDASDLVVNYDGPRKRKVRNERGEWVDPKELEGRVIEHGVEIPQTIKPKRMKRTLFHQHYYTGDDFNRGYDPFRLVPTSYYNDIVLPPFEVEIVSDALLVMDFHSHLAHTEIIGLMGGNFITKSDTKCEMDPASEMRAREVFAEQGYNVVGWYHSHPTFEPHPSIRDIENQTSYQTLFREEESGDEPFIGVIVTPYDAEIQSDHSQFQYLHISKEWNESHSYRVPYACKRRVEQCEEVSDCILDQLKALIDEYKDYEHKVDMASPFGTSTRLEKLLDSLRTHLFIKAEQEAQFIDKVKELVEKEFMKSETNQNVYSPHL